MKSKQLTKIETKSKFVFVSPHFDDAIFSAGSLIEYLSSKKKTVTVINIFTSEGEIRNTLSAKMFLKQCGYKSKTKLYKDRQLEDSSLLKSLKVNVINLGFVEALWRRKKTSRFMEYLSRFIPELAAMYPTYSLHISEGKVASQDRETINDIAEKLANIKEVKEADYIFCPLGIGKHVDHIVTNKAVRKLKRNNTIVWTDYPYIIFNKDKQSYIPYFEFKPDWQIKESLFKKYKTQYNAIFGTKGISKRNELFYKLSK